MNYDFEREMGIEERLEHQDIARRHVPTRVVNVRPKDHRSVLPKYDISIMRPGPLGNPFRLGIDGTRDQVVVKFESYARDRIRKDAKYRALVESLRGKVLGCCCHPLKCHGDIYVKLLDEMERGEL